MPRTVHSHGSTPASGWQVHGGAGDTFGVEFETSRSTRRFSRGWGRDYCGSLEDMADHATPSAFWYPETDGSVSGIEFVSHPATLDYWRSIAPDLAAMVAGLRTFGATTNGAGMHVNIGRSAFGSAEHVIRFITLVDANPRWATRMAGRAHSELSWCKFRSDGDRRYAAADWYNRRPGYTDRYQAVNLNNLERIEFRLPKAALSADRILAMVEWTAAMVEYTRDSLHPLTAHAFCTWSAQDSVAPRFPAMVARLRDRFPARFGGPVRVDAHEPTLCEAAYNSADGGTFLCSLRAGHAQDWHEASTPGGSTYTWPANGQSVCDVHGWTDCESVECSRRAQDGPGCPIDSTDGYMCENESGHAGLHEALDGERRWGGAFGTRSQRRDATYSAAQAVCLRCRATYEQHDGMLRCPNSAMGHGFLSLVADECPEQGTEWACELPREHGGQHAAPSVRVGYPDSWQWS